MKQMQMHAMWNTTVLCVEDYWSCVWQLVAFNLELAVPCLWATKGNWQQQYGSVSSTERDASAPVIKAVLETARAPGSWVCFEEWEYSNSLPLSKSHSPDLGLSSAPSNCSSFLPALTTCPLHKRQFFFSELEAISTSNGRAFPCFFFFFFWWITHPWVPARVTAGVQIPVPFLSLMDHMRQAEILGEMQAPNS